MPTEVTHVGARINPAMSVLDQAFFKAYGVVEPPDEAEAPEAVHAAEGPIDVCAARDPEAVCAAETTGSALEGRSADLGSGPAWPRFSASILAGAEWPCEKPADSVAPSSGSNLSDRAAPRDTPGHIGKQAEPSAPAGEQSESPLPMVPESVAPMAAEPGGVAAGAEPPLAAPADAARAGGAAAVTPPPAAAGAESPMQSAEAPQSARDFSPQLQVDRYFWPAGVVRLCQVAQGPLDAVIDSVALAAAQGKNVVGVGHCRAGDGATTLLLCLARRLAEHGVKVAIVDADLRSPRLARRLGVLAEQGWHDVWAGRLSLAEALVESLHDRLALLPVADGAAGQPLNENKSQALRGEVGSAAAPSPAAAVAELRKHYDVVLVDLGSCSQAAAMLAPGGGHPWVDRAIIVRNQRRPRPAEFAAAVGHMQSLGIETAVVDNFV